MISQSEKTNPISEMAKMNANIFITKDYENEPPSGPKKTKPKQTQFQTRRRFFCLLRKKLPPGNSVNKKIPPMMINLKLAENLRLFRKFPQKRCGIYGNPVRAFLDRCGIEKVRTAYRNPWQNPFVERFIGTLRREILNHVIVFGRGHLAFRLEKNVELSANVTLCHSIDYKYSKLVSIKIFRFIYFFPLHSLLYGFIMSLLL